MDMQGKPIGGGGDGTKVTSDPDGKRNPVHESAGPVASDSLAAESAREGGGFANNPNANPSGVPGSKSTLANTDTSAAHTLDAAPDAAAREERDTWGESADLKGAGGIKYAEALGGQPDFPGQVSDQGYSGGPTGGGGSSGGGASSSSGGVGQSGGGTGSSSGGVSQSGSSGAGYRDSSASSGGAAQSGSGRDANAAPSYVQSVLQGGDGKPKGRNLQEGGFEGSGPSNDLDIGGENDPGRAALGKFQERNEAAVGSTGPIQRTLDNKTDFDALGNNEQT